MVKKKEKLVVRVPGSVDFDMTERQYLDLTLTNHVGVRVNVHVYEDSSGWHGWRDNDRSTPVVTWMRVIWWPVEETNDPNAESSGARTEESKPGTVIKLAASSLYGKINRETVPRILQQLENETAEKVTESSSQAE